MKLFLVDDNAAFRSALRDLFSTIPDIEIIGEASNGESALPLVQSLKPDIVLMDLRMPGMNGIAATSAIRSSQRPVCVMVLTTFDDDELVTQAMAAGASGYLLKGTPIEELADILRLARRGYRAFSPGIVPAPRPDPELQQIRKLAERLTERERTVWALIGAGKTNRDIAQHLHLTEGTVKNYVTNILSVLQIKHRTQAALLWSQISQ